MQNQIPDNPLSKMQHVALIEEDYNFRKLIQLELNFYGFIVELTNEEECKTLPITLISGEISLLIKTAQTIRKSNEDCWIIALANHTLSPNDRIKLLNAGFDDYFEKNNNLSFEEIASKLNRILYRTKNVDREGILEYDELKLDLFNRKVWRKGKEIELRAKEFELLRVFMQYTEEVLTREFLFHQVWGTSFLGDSNVIEVYVRYLRAKLKKPYYIKTERGKGYIFISDDITAQNADLTDFDKL